MHDSGHMSLIAITAAAGRLGSLVVDQLLAQVPAERVVAIVRNPARATHLGLRGVAVRQACYDEPAELERALAGVERMLLISASEGARRVEQHSNVLGAAKRAGVQLVAYTSLLHADRSPLVMARDHLATEAELRAMGLRHIVLRNGWYHDNYTVSAKPSLAHGGYLGCAGAGRISSAARADYAAAAVAALMGAADEGRTYELAGDEAYTLPMLAEAISRLSGRPLSYINVPESEYASVLASVGIPRSLAEDIASWDTAASKGALFDDGHELSTLIGRPTTPIVEALREALR